MGMFEARSRIQSNRSTNYVLSTQDIVSCSEYSQGCEGGKSYLYITIVRTVYLTVTVVYELESYMSGYLTRCVAPSWLSDIYDESE